MTETAPRSFVHVPPKQYIPLRATRQGSAPGIRPRQLVLHHKESQQWGKPVKPPTIEPNRPRTASGSKKLQYALVCARLLAENNALELAAKRTETAALPQRKRVDRQSRGRCKSASTTIQRKEVPSSNQQCSSRFIPVAEEIIPLASLTCALQSITHQTVNKLERDELCRTMIDLDLVHTTSLDGYSLGKVVGVGTFGKVRIATHKLSCQVVAIKTYERSRTKDAGQWKRIQYEAKLMEKLDHPYIIRLFETIETPTKLHIIMENVSSDVGNLCEFVKQHKRLSEVDAGHLFMQVLSAVMHMHSMQLIHRDIKLENILLDRYGNTKLVDFGFSAIQSTAKPFTTFCGTPCYMAPEIIHRKSYWGQPVDVWSLGVLLFAMLCGFFPFRARNYNDLYRKIVKGQFDIPGTLTSEVHTLLRGMLEGDPTKRFTLQTVRAHPWCRRFDTSQHQHLPLYRQLSLGLLSDAVGIALQRILYEHIEVLGISRTYLQTALNEKRYNSLSTLYYLLLHRSEVLCRNQPLPSTNTIDLIEPNDDIQPDISDDIQPDISDDIQTNEALLEESPQWESHELRDVVEMLDKGP